MKSGRITISRSSRGVTVKATGKAADGLFTKLMNHATVDTKHSATCVGCSCTDARACPGGCWWLDVDRTLRLGICSSCESERDSLLQRLEEARNQARG